jgi:hypothetical protein
MSGVIQCFVSHTAGKATIANNSYHLVALAGTITGQSHAQGR